MFKKEEEKIATLVVQGIAAGCALIGFLAHGENEDYAVENAWGVGDRMAAEFMRRGKATEEADDAGKK